MSDTVRSDRRAQGGLAAAAVVAAVMLSGACGGCAWSSCDNVHFSPDGKRIAFTRHRGRFAGFTAGLTPVGVGSESVEVCWCPSDRPDQLRSATIHGRGPFFPAPSAQEHVKEIRFSPDSSRLAVRTERRLLVADLTSGQARQVNLDERVPHSVRWLGNEEIVFATLPRPKQPGTTAELYVCRWKIDDPVDEPVKPLHKYAFDLPSGKLFWSPNGRYALHQASWLAKCVLLDVIDGKERNVGPAATQLQACAWKHDSSLVFCAMQYAPRGGARADQPATEALLLIQPGSGQTERLPGKDLGLASTVRSAEWTADGKYVLVDDGWTHCALVQPKPWLVISLKKRVVNTLRNHGQTVTSWKELHPMPVAGWLWMRDHDGKCLALDYRWQTIMELAKGSRWGYSPDGRQIAEVDDEGKVTLRRVDLPAGPPPETARRPAPPKPPALPPAPTPN